MGRSSGRTSARTCPRCAALLLTDATSCGICRMDLTAPAPPPAPEPEPPAPEEPVVDDVVVDDVVVNEAMVDAVVNDVVVADEFVAEPEPSAIQPFEPTAVETAPEVIDGPVAEAPVFDAPVFEAPAFEAPLAEAPVFDPPVAEAPVAETPVVEAPVVEAPVMDPVTDGSTAPESGDAPVASEAAPTDQPKVTDSNDDLAAPPLPPTRTHRAVDSRTLTAPTGLSRGIAVVGVLQALTVGISVLLAWWAVEQLQSALDPLFTADATSIDSVFPAIGSNLDASIATAATAAVVATVSMVLSLAVVVCLMVWTSKARQVSDAVSTGQHRIGPVWAVIGWIVPLASLLVPFQAVSDLYKSADPRTSQTRGHFTGPTPGLVAAWWGTWVTSSVLFVVQLVQGRGDEPTTIDIPTFSPLQWLWLLSTVASTVLMIVVVRRITAWQQAQVTGNTADNPTPQSAFDPRFSSDWNDTAPIPGLPRQAPLDGELASAGSNDSQQLATQAYQPPASPPGLDQSRINPRDPFSFPPPGQVG